jgi:hypothetical protein
MRRRTDREQRKTLAKEGVPGINDLDVSPFLFLRVLERGIKLIARSITSTMRHSCANSTPIRL